MTVTVSPVMIDVRGLFFGTEKRNFIQFFGEGGDVLNEEEVMGLHVCQKL